MFLSGQDFVRSVKM